MTTKKSVECPVFIVSAGRSGSTYLRKLLLISGKINLPPESGAIIPNAINKYLTSKISTKEAVKQAFLESPEFQYWNLQSSDIDKWIARADRRSAGDIISSVYKAYADRFDFPEDVWGDKTPYLIYFIPEMKILFPNARFIHIVRSPVDVINSRMVHFNENLDIALHRWKSSVRCTTPFRHDPKFLEVKYENLISSRSCIDGVYSFLGLGRYSEENLKKKVHMGDVELSHHLRVVSGGSKTPQLLSEGDRTYIKSVIRKEMKVFGYK